MHVHGKHAAPASHRRQVLHGLLVSGLAVTTVTAAGVPATADSASLGDQYSINVPAVAERTIAWSRACVRRGSDQPTCTPGTATTPGTHATDLRLVWSLVGQTSGVDKSLASGSPVDCGDDRGIELALSSQGGDATLTLAGYATERNISGNPVAEEQPLFEPQRFEIGGEGDSVAVSLCFPA